MTALDDIVAKFRQASPNIAAAFDEVQRRLAALEGGAPPPPPPPPSGYKWNPDTVCPLVTPTNIVATGGNLALDRAKDYVVRVAARAPVVIDGGRNVRISGKVDIPSTAALNEGARRGIIVRNVQGVIWVSDLLLTGDVVSGARRAIADGLVIESPDADAMYLTKMRAEGLSEPVQGNWDSAHPDAFFSWRPARKNYIDLVTFESTYQGMLMSHSGGVGNPAESWEVSRVNCKPIGDGPIAIWPTDGPHVPYGFDTTYTFADCYVGAPYKYGLEKAVGVEIVQNRDGSNWHMLGSQPGEPAVRAGWQFKHANGTAANMSASVPGDYVEWTNVNGKTGRITFGDPPGGDYVKAGSVG